MYPRLFEWLPITNYGILALLGLLAGVWLSLRIARRAGLEREVILDVSLWGILAALVGAKVAMVLVYLPDYLENPRDLIQVVRYAGVWYGGLIAGVGFLLVYAHLKELSVLRLLDVLAPGTALGHAFGRVGCFLAGCCWGTRCELPWAVTFHSEEAWRRVGTPLGQPLHPVQLYEAGAELLLCGLLILLWRKNPARGVPTAVYIVLYGLVRFGLEFVRGDERGMFGPLTTSQWLALALVTATLATACIVAVRRGGSSPEEPPPGV